MIDRLLEHKKYIWGFALVLFAACWFLPIHANDIGYDGAVLAHKEFWKLVTGETKNLSILEIIFISISWLANELFVLGLLAYRKWPNVALYLFAGSLGIMLSWQVMFLKEFPVLIGYWVWVAAGALVLWLTVDKLAQDMKSDYRTIVLKPLLLLVFLFPLLIATAGVMSAK